MAEFEKRFTTLYLGYSSNLSPVTMKQRYPDSLFVGIALLKDYKWIINSTSYALIIPSVRDVVYGSPYFLSGRDEKALDTSEGVPWLYVKPYLDVHRVVDGKKKRRLPRCWLMLMCNDVRRALLSRITSYG
jgi:gamma-glutamylcyclotransferase